MLFRSKEFREFQKTQFEKKTQEYETQLAQLKQAKKEAINSGDGERAVAIEDAMDDIKVQNQAAKEELKVAEAKAKQMEKPIPQPDEHLTQWMEDNSWYGKDEKLRSVANSLGEQIRRENPGLIGKPFLDKLDQELADFAPEKFGKRRTPNPMEGSTAGSARPSAIRGKKSYDSLPADAKAACDRFVKQGLMTKEQYVSEYSWD